MNQDLFAALSMHASWYAREFDELRPLWYVFPFCSRVKPVDPNRPVTTIKTSWESTRKAARVDCRFHDLRHTFATKLAEAGVPESTILALMGHMSRRMLERYSHIRMAAKREAVEAVALQVEPRISGGVPTNSPTVGPF